MITRDIPNGPWEEICHQLLHTQRDYLLICNTFRKYPFLFKMSMKTTQMTYQSSKQLFTQCGPARKLFMDNRWPFSSEKFTTYKTQQQVQHVTLSLPLCPVKWIHQTKHQNHQRNPHKKTILTSKCYMISITTSDQTL